MYNFFESLMFWYSHVIHKLSSEKKKSNITDSCDEYTHNRIVVLDHNIP